MSDFPPPPPPPFLSHFSVAKAFVPTVAAGSLAFFFLPVTTTGELTTPSLRHSRNEMAPKTMRSSNQSRLIWFPDELVQKKKGHLVHLLLILEGEGRKLVKCSRRKFEDFLGPPKKKKEKEKVVGAIATEKMGQSTTHSFLNSN